MEKKQILLLFLSSFIYFMCCFPHMDVYYICTWCLWNLEEGCKSTNIGLTRGCEPSCGFQELNLCSLKVQILLAAGPSLQPFVMLIFNNCKEILIYKSFHINYRGNGLFCCVCLCVLMCLTLAVVHVHACVHVYRCVLECCSCHEAESSQSLVRYWWSCVNIFQKYFKFKNF